MQKSSSHSRKNAPRSSQETRKPGEARAKPGRVSPEYREYEQRHALLGDDRPKLTPDEFERLDDELLELLALDTDRLTDEQVVRIQELEYLLIDSE